MSGGSLDYIQYKLDDTAGQIISRSHGRKDGALLRAFASHLKKIGEACHAIEWDFSGDSSMEPKDHDLIRSLMERGAELKQAIIEAKDAYTTLEIAIEEAEAKR